MSTEVCVEEMFVLRKVRIQEKFTSAKSSCPGKVYAWEKFTPKFAFRESLILRKFVSRKSLCRGKFELRKVRAEEKVCVEKQFALTKKFGSEKFNSFFSREKD